MIQIPVTQGFDQDKTVGVLSLTEDMADILANDPELFTVSFGVKLNNKKELVEMSFVPKLVVQQKSS